MALKILRNYDPLEFYKDCKYLESDSLALYKYFLKQNNYADSSCEDKLRMAQRLHIEYPILGTLKKAVKERGIINVGVNKDGSTYLHFLAMIGLLPISFNDYYDVNPKTITKICNWYKPYYEQMGINSFLESFAAVMNKNSRNINIEKTGRKAEHCCVYLIMKYGIHHIDDLTEKQWRETVKELRNKSKTPANHIPAQLMGQTLFERGIISEEAIFCFDNRSKKVFSYEDLEEVLPIIEKYEYFIRKQYKKTTCEHKLKALDEFFKFAKKNNIRSLDKVNRSTIHKFKEYYFKKGFTASNNQSVMYGIKLFLQFIEANSYELTTAGYKIPTKKVVVKKDFKVKSVYTLPRPIDKITFNAMMQEIKLFPDKRFALTFLLMATTGLALADVLALENDCLREKADGSFQLRIYRVKRDKYYEVKIRPEVVEIIKSLNKTNTQTRPMNHGSGKEVYYLINVDGRPATQMWYKDRYKKLKQNIIDKYPDLEKTVNEATPHRIRHTFASRMRDNGADIYTLAYLLGHESIRTTQKYVKESDRRKQEYIDRLNKKYVCDAIDDVSVLTASEKGLQALSEMLETKIYIGIGACAANRVHDCPMAHKCIDCQYLCSTVEDLPELYGLIEGMKANYDSLKEQGDEESAEYYRRKIVKLLNKIKKLEETKINIPK